jgi:hypothetical protein
LGFLRRNLQHCPRECRKIAYIALVRSIMEYGAIIWDPYNKNDINKLEQGVSILFNVGMFDYYGECVVSDL